MRRSIFQQTPSNLSNQRHTHKSTGAGSSIQNGGHLPPARELLRELGPSLGYNLMTFLERTRPPY